MPASLISNLSSVVQGLAAALGPSYCIALYAAGEEQDQLAAMVANGHVAGIATGARAIEADRAAIENVLQHGSDYAANYLSRAADGRRLRSTLARINGSDGELIGFLAIHYDLAQAELLRGMVDQLAECQPLAAETQEAPEKPTRLDELLEQGLRKARQYLGKPLAYASKVEKIQIVERLDREGFFLLKGSIEALAKYMGNTKYTVYSYLRENRIRVAD